MFHKGDVQTQCSLWSAYLILRYGSPKTQTGAGESGVTLERLNRASLFVRRHSANMTRGKSLLELNTLRVLKKAPDKKRQEASDVAKSARP